MKTVRTSDMVCHLWANKHTHEVRTRSRNLYSESGALFSYGSHFVIAAHLDEPKSGTPFILWNNAKTSNTTNKHRGQTWCALSSAQRAACVSVPVTVSRKHLTADGLRELANACIKAAARPLEKCAKARDRFGFYVSEAADAFRAARRLFEYVGDTKAARTVPVFPENPTKADAARVLLEINRAEILARANAAREHARRALELADADAAEYGRQKWASARSVCANAVRSVRSVQTAREEYKRAAVRVPAELAQTEKKARAIVAQFEARAQTEADAERRADILNAARDLMRELARFNNAKRRGMEPERTNRANRLRARGLDVSWKLNRLSERLGFAFFESADAARIFPDAAELAELARIFKRAERISETDALRGQIAHLAEAVRDIDARTARGFEPANPATVRQRLRFPRFPVFWRQKGETLAAQADAVRAEWFKRETERNAETVTRWRAGEAVRLPNGLPTMARIRGDVVETSRGATVPLSHAVRLVKLARKIAADGGAVFADGSGPSVGHFRVNRIGADFSAVIGCHEFTAEESARTIADIEKCAEACAV
jgi:hypothetical protein